MSISIKLYVLSDFSSDIIALNIHKALLRLTIINKHKVSQYLGQFFEFVQSIVDICNLLQVFIFLCNEESNLNVGWLAHVVLLDCDTHPPHVVRCYVTHFVAVGKLLIHS